MNVIIKPLRVLRSILPKEYKLRIVGISSLLLLNSVLELIGLGALIPVFTILLEDNVVEKYAWARYLYENFNLTSGDQLIVLVSLLLLTIIVIKNVLGLVIAYIQSKFAFSLYEHFSVKMHGIYFRRGFSFFKNSSAHDLFRNVNNASLLFAQKQILGLLGLLNECFIFLIILIGIALYDPKIFGLLLITVTPTFSIFYLYVRKKSLKIGEIQKKIAPLLSKSIFESFYGYVDILLAKKEDVYRNNVKGHLHESSQIQVTTSVLNLAPTRVIETSLMLAIVLIIIFGLQLSMAKMDLIKQLGIFAIAGYRIMPSINRIMLAMNGLNQTFWTHDILKSLNTESPDLIIQKELSFNETLSLNNISFQFDDSPTPLFSDYSLNITKGECLGIKGASGSGKTTLMNMLLGFIPPQQGTFKVDDVTYTPEHMNSYYEKVGYVQQQVYLMDGTIADNIALGVSKENLDQELLKQALEKASLSQFVADLPNGVNSTIGEGGTKISGGQRQRIGIARALYRKVEILFFDEATSALDEQTEKEISDAINRLAETNLTIIIIAHRLKTLERCDRIIDLGRIQTEKKITPKPNKPVKNSTELSKNDSNKPVSENAKTVLVYYEKNSTNAPRVHKQLDALLLNYKVILVTKKFEPNILFSSNLKIVLLPKSNAFFPSLTKLPFKERIVDQTKRLLSGDFLKHPLERNFWNNQLRTKIKFLSDFKYDCIIAHHPSSLVLASELSRHKRIPFIFNAHEYYPGQFEHKEGWVKNKKPELDYILKKYLPKASTTFCVGQIIGETYIKEFKINDFVFIPNDKPYFNVLPRKTGKPIRIVHHGGAIRGRSIHKSIEMIGFLPEKEYELHLMLMPVDKKYLEELVLLSKKFNNVFFHEPVSFEKIIPFLSTFDIGLYLLPPTNFNNLNCLPNKIYEFIQARLCIVTSPNPEMSTLIKRNGLGLCSEDYTAQSMAATIQSISPLQIDEFKQHVHSKAKELSSETTENLIRQTVSSIV